MVRSLLKHPDRLFLLIAVSFGLLFAFLTRPFGGGDEHFHYQRTAEIAYLHVLDKQSELPRGIVLFLQSGKVHYLGVRPRQGTAADYPDPASITLDAAHSGTVNAHIFTVHNPIDYVPQAVAFRLAAIAGVRPLGLLYIARVAGLAAAIWLTWLAIRIMPTHRYLLAGCALLPTVVFYRSFLQSDTIAIALAFLYLACALRAITRSGAVTGRELTLLAATAIGVASTKGAYLPLTALVLAIPAHRFIRPAGKWRYCAAVIGAAFVMGFGWMQLVKNQIFTGYFYHTWAGNPVPDQQIAFILHHPLGYLGAVLRTLLETPFFAVVFRGLLAQLGQGNVFLSAWEYGLLFFMLAGLAATDDTGRAATYSQATRLWALVLFLACAGLSLTLLYIQWNAVQAPVILGFQGRYLTPALPLLFLFIKPAGEARRDLAGLALCGLGIFGLSAAAWTLMASQTV